jgi:hypothetical protein
MSDQRYKVAVVQAARGFVNLQATLDKGIALIDEPTTETAP